MRFPRIRGRVAFCEEHTLVPGKTLIMETLTAESNREWRNGNGVFSERHLQYLQGELTRIAAIQYEKKCAPADADNAVVICPGTALNRSTSTKRKLFSLMS